MNAVNNFIIAPDTRAGSEGVDALKQLLAGFTSDATRIRSLVGSPDAPRRAVIALTGDEARALQARYAGRLLIEADATLYQAFSSTKNPNGTR